jgi:DNA (cytosine-5)-methyltransferase 1
MGLHERMLMDFATGPDGLTFIDLFAGIGGMRLALEDCGASCVFSSEWDRFAQQTYEANFGEKPEGDIREIDAADIPEHDILLAGFPCQPFSISGVSKKLSLGRPHGFDDPTQGTLFFEIKRILDAHRPKAFLLENVKNLQSHDKGRTFAVIMAALREDLGYTVYTKVVDAAAYVPQHRERIFMVGFRDDVDFDFPDRDVSAGPKLRSILDEFVDPKYTLTDHLWSYLQDYAAKHRAKGNGFGFGLADLDGVTRTLSARYYKDGSEILIPQSGKNPRRLTPPECAQLMGFTQLRPDFQIPVSDTQAYKQFGNAVVPPVVADIGHAMVDALARHEQAERDALQAVSA